jgi:hypothetical protein
MTTLVVKVNGRRFAVTVSGDPAAVLAAYKAAGITVRVVDDHDAA